MVFIGTLGKWEVMVNKIMEKEVRWYERGKLDQSLSGRIDEWIGKGG